MSKLKESRVSREPAGTSTPEDEKIIRPFRYRATDEQLDDLRRRVAATHWPEKETVNDQSQGVQLDAMKKLAQYWATDYDWRKVEAKLSALPQFITEIDGLDIHFIHVRSKHEGALPLIVTHGWPGSVIEQLKIIDPLVNPTAHGGTAEDAFHLVIPSIPGFGFSGKPTTTGWDPARIARTWTTLMQRLGYATYGAQGGDWGAIINDQLALQAPPGLVGQHTNLPGAVPAEIVKALRAGGDAPDGLTEEEKTVYARLDYFFKKGLAMYLEMGSRPQTLYGIADSPIGLAAWMLDHDLRSYELIVRAFNGESTGLTRDDVLDNLTFFWLTNTAISAARIYWENKLDFFAAKGVSLPTGVTAFPDEIFTAPRSWAERAYPKLVHYNKPAQGGHFGAWEQPKILTEDVRATFRSLRA